jgi:5-methylcytosine-specific restriction endonuclease McrA
MRAQLCGLRPFPFDGGESMNWRSTSFAPLANSPAFQLCSLAAQGLLFRWLTIRIEIDERPHFNYRCVACSADDVPLTRDHIIPISRGGSDAIENIQPLCQSCNSRKHTNAIDYRNRLS